MEKMQWKTWFYIGLVLFSSWTVYLYFDSPAILGWMTREDALLESLSAVFYLIAAGIFFFEWGSRGCKNVFILGYALLFLFVGGEELSWGQRMIGVATPESLAAINVQSEANLHNIDGIYQHIRRVGVLIVLAIAIVMPLSKQWNLWLRDLYVRMSLPVVPLWTVPLTVFAIMFMAVPRIFWGKIIFSLDEIGEFYLSITFLLFALHQRNSKPRF